MILQSFVQDFAVGIETVDASCPIWTSAITKRAYAPGIGPHPESATVRLVADQLLAARSGAYLRGDTNVPYPAVKKQRCDLVIAASGEVLAIEVKLLRFMGDNGKPNDNTLMHILSPYPAHRSAVTDCEKLTASGFQGTTAVLIYGFDYEDWPMDPAIDAFEILASRRCDLGLRLTASFERLVHPIHTHGRVFGWTVNAGAS